MSVRGDAGCRARHCRLTRLIPCRTDMIAEMEPITNTFISVPPQFGHLNCAAFVAGIIGGLLDGAGFVSAACCADWTAPSTC